MKDGLRILILGDQAGNPVIHGSGSGQVISNFEYSPLQAFCDEFKVNCQSNVTGVWTSCNDAGTCISYNGVDSNNGMDKKKKEFDGSELEANQYDYTFIFEGRGSGEGGDRKDYD